MSSDLGNHLVFFYNPFFVWIDWLNTSQYKYGYQYGCSLWVDKLGLEKISDFTKCHHWEKILGQEWNFRSGVKLWVVSKILGSEWNFGLGETVRVGNESLGQERNFWLEAKFWVGIKISGRDQNFGLGAKFCAGQEILGQTGSRVKEAVTFRILRGRARWERRKTLQGHVTTTERQNIIIIIWGLFTSFLVHNRGLKSNISTSH